MKCPLPQMHKHRQTSQVKPASKDFSVHELNEGRTPDLVIDRHCHRCTGLDGPVR